MEEALTVAVPPPQLIVPVVLAAISGCAVLEDTVTGTMLVQPLEGSVTVSV
jgi:hypothetical protein